MRIVTLDETSKQNLLNDLLKRSPNHYGEFIDRVNDIIQNVRTNGDAAIFDYTKRFDGAQIDASNIRVTEDEIKAAFEPSVNTTEEQMKSNIIKLIELNKERNETDNISAILIKTV